MLPVGERSVDSDVNVLSLAGTWTLRHDRERADSELDDLMVCPGQIGLKPQARR